MNIFVKKNPERSARIRLEDLFSVEHSLLCRCTLTFSGDNLRPACQAVELAVVTCHISYKVPNCVN